MSVLTEDIALSRSKERDLCSIKKLNCWGSNLSDITIVRKMKSVEILSFSLNSITSLADFAYCSYLKELYLRKNKIEDLNELHHLEQLEHLHSLWLEDNPCTQQKNYRFTVLQILPKLKVLDNISVNPDEIRKAMVSDDVFQSSFNISSVLHPISPQLQLPVEAMDNDSKTIPDTDINIQNPTNTDWGFPYISSSSSNSNEKHRHEFSSGEETFSKHELRITPCKNNFSIHQEAFHAKVLTMFDHPLSEAEDMGCLDICSSGSDINPLTLISSNENAVERVTSLTSDIKKVSFEKCTSSPKEIPCSHFASVQDFKVSSSAGINPMDDNLPSSFIHTSWKTLNSNLLSAVLCLVKELDYASLEVVKNAVLCRMDEI